MTPIAQREIVSVTRSQTRSQRSSSPGMSTLASDALEVRDVREQEEADEEDREAGEEDAEEGARDAEDGRDRVGDRDGDLLGARPARSPPRPSRRARRARPTRAGPATSAGGPGGSRARSRRAARAGAAAAPTTASAVPSTVTVAARPRDMRVFAITKRTGYSKTNARKMPMKTIRNVSPIADERGHERRSPRRRR